MTLPTVKVEAVFTDPQGQPYAGAELVVRIDRTEIYNNLVIPRRVVYELNEEGRAELHLWPNDLGSTGSQYLIELYRGRTLVFEAEAVFPSAEGPLNLHDYTRLQPYPAKSTVERLAENIRRHAATASNAIREALAGHKNEPNPHPQYMRKDAFDGSVEVSAPRPESISLDAPNAVINYDDGSKITVPIHGSIDGGTFDA